MVVTLSESMSRKMLTVLGKAMDAGQLELLSGEAKVLAVLQLSDPATHTKGDELKFNTIADAVARSEGRCEIARVVAIDGTEIFSCDVGTESSNAVLKLNSTRLYLGGQLRISSFRLSMP